MVAVHRIEVELGRKAGGRSLDGSCERRAGAAAAAALAEGYRATCLQ